MTSSRTLDMKMCTKCLEVKTVSGFGTETRGGYKSHCRVCRSGRVRNRKQEGEYGKRYRLENRDKRREQKSRRRGLMYSVHCTPYSRAEIFARWGAKCCYCDAEAEALDHVTPIVKGGADAAWNLVPACTSCNSSKGAKSLAQWAMSF
jgi:5-methylcytosine-specific restriction endonuclease McrA